MGRTGDWDILSFPKILAVEAGGALVGREAVSGTAGQAEWLPAAGRWWARWPEQAERRREVFHELEARFRELSLSPAIRVDHRITPWFFPVRVPEPGRVIGAARAAGVDCGLWHGTDIVVFPCHQFLAAEHLDRIAAAARQGLAS